MVTCYGNNSCQIIIMLFCRRSTLVMSRRRYFKSVSVFPYTGRYFFQVGSVFVLGFSKYRGIGSVFSIIHFASKRHVQILNFASESVRGF